MIETVEKEENLNDRINLNYVYNTPTDGITLIALVITIVVLIILAGIAISMLSGENGILNQAARAKQQTEEQSTLEQVKLATTAAIANENRSVDKDILDKDLKSYGFEQSTVDEENNYTTKKGEKTYEISNDGDISEVVTEPPVEEVEIKTKFIDTTSENKAVIIPECFKVSSVDLEQQIDTGLVVIAPDESEFVWIPVEESNTMYGIDEDGNKLGKLYQFTDTNNTPLNWSLTEEGVMSWTNEKSYREPEILTAYDTDWHYYQNVLGHNSSTDFEKAMRKEFADMIDSVEKNKGFYVGRYETSLSNGIAKSVRGEISATADSSSANTWYGLYQKEKEYSEKNSLSSVVVSSMIWGSQYDQMMRWMQKNGINVASSTPISGASKNTGTGSAVGTTGTVETDKLNNIYDILGNGLEWTLEAYVTNCRVRRRR